MRPPAHSASTYTPTLCCVCSSLKCCPFAVTQSINKRLLNLCPSQRGAVRRHPLCLFCLPRAPGEVQRWGLSARSDVCTQARGQGSGSLQRSQPSKDWGAVRRDLKGFTPRAPFLFSNTPSSCPPPGLGACGSLPLDHSWPEPAGSLSAATRRSPLAPHIRAVRPLRPPSLARPRLTPSESCPLHLLEMYRLLALPTRRPPEAGMSSSPNVMCPQPWHSAWRTVGPL